MMVARWSHDGRVVVTSHTLPTRWHSTEVSRCVVPLMPTRPAHAVKEVHGSPPRGMLKQRGRFTFRIPTSIPNAPHYGSNTAKMPAKLIPVIMSSVISTTVLRWYSAITSLEAGHVRMRGPECAESSMPRPPREVCLGCKLRIQA